MEAAPLLGGMSGPEDEDEMGPDLFGAESGFTPGSLPLKGPAAGKAEEDEFPVFRDPYLSPADPKPLLPALSPPLGVDFEAKVKAELLLDEAEGEMLAGFPGLPELDALDEAALPAPQAYNVHLLSSLLAPPRPVLPLGAWALEGAAHPGVRVVPVEVKDGAGALTSESPEEVALQSPLSQESCKFPSSQDAEDAPGGSQKDSGTMVLCQLKGGAQMLCIDGSSARELKALHLVPQYQDQNSSLQSDVPKPVTTLVGRFLPVPAKLNLIAQQLDSGAAPPAAPGPAFPQGPALPGPPKITLAGYCDCLAGGDVCTNCGCTSCCSSLRHGIERFKAIRACLDRNPEAFQPKAGPGRVGDAKSWLGRGCHCKRSGCLKSYCECFEGKATCSSACKCVGCRNYEDSPERRSLPATPGPAEAGGSEDGQQAPGRAKFRRDRRSCISWEVVQAACACLLAQGEEAERGRCSQGLAEQMVLEEFGRCLSQILHIEFQSKGLAME